MKLQVKRRRSRIEITPMIDVIFFMLIFFFMFATFKQAQTGVEVQLPKTVHIGNNEQNMVVISIDKNARIFFGKEAVSLEELRQQVQQELANDSTTRFIIKPDGDVPYKQIIMVTDILASEGVVKPLWGVDRQQLFRAE
jgi:biopolymer transport protein ExbD